ncbi:hypothetical protein [Alicyclobacillus sp. SO9]|uniref:hypothetical protein n=1 Tax=Alicyclobacillus sp. SO9 TaxID=2665646 RepID=UPI0018E7CA15|nr:hypothetical protein [Alicyclobacillus sp. SO9]QQE78994.1 hypothetical protein GI364_00230 [Alicyclobacillus sp. SO9]
MEDRHHLTELRWEWQKLKQDESLPKPIRDHNIKKLMNTLEMKFAVPGMNECGICAPNQEAQNFYEELSRHL